MNNVCFLIYSFMYKSDFSSLLFLLGILLNQPSLHLLVQSTLQKKLITEILTVIIINL